MKYKVTKCVDDFNVEFASNGYIVRYSGRDDEDEYQNDTVLIGDLQALYQHIEKLESMPRE
jgi:hypothetical protein